MVAAQKYFVLCANIYKSESCKTTNIDPSQAFMWQYISKMHLRVSHSLDYSDVIPFDLYTVIETVALNIALVGTFKLYLQTKWAYIKLKYLKQKLGVTETDETKMPSGL